MAPARTPTAVQYLEGERTRKAALVREMTDTAEKEGRGLTDEEKSKAEAVLGDIAGIETQLKSFRDSDALNESIDRLGQVKLAPASVDGKTHRAPRSIGEAFVQSDGYKALKSQGLKGKWSTGQIDLPGVMFGSKASITDDDGNVVLAEGTDAAGNIVGGPGGDVPQPDVRPGIQAPGFQRLTIADLMAPGSTTSNTVRYFVETSGSQNNAASVHEGANKPASRFVFDAVDEPVRKIATLLPVSDEMLEDVAQIRSYLDTRLRQFVQIEEEDQLLNGVGTGDDLNGLLNRVTQTIDATDYDNLYDAIAAARVLVQTVGFAEPDAIVINPNDAFDLDTLKAVAGTGGYFSGGPYAAAPNSLWGTMRLVRTTAIAAGHVLVGAFSTQAQVYRRTGLTVEASNSHEDYFGRNLTAIRAEERLALAVYRINAFTEITNAS